MGFDANMASLPMVIIWPSSDVSVAPSQRRLWFLSPSSPSSTTTPHPIIVSRADCPTACTQRAPGPAPQHPVLPRQPRKQSPGARRRFCGARGHQVGDFITEVAVRRLEGVVEGRGSRGACGRRRRRPQHLHSGSPELELLAEEDEERAP
ncbi:hypothetical protein FIBSPDRAFT_1038528 [Athelia psychrophila]|uniref:Uncharacterized protein n=1 Tax=Athelia psychrophila TaxID=1759441 RepID=A0A166T5B5_9AGAM|nr:hypothetical protein FIBSPDRAFT_1038528 [Fibularhizoctonia sp. CBS 109695]